MGTVLSQYLVALPSEFGRCDVVQQSGIWGVAFSVHLHT